MAKRFFYVCAGLFLLALSYHFGARSATAQAGATGFGYAQWSGYAFVMTPNGDVFVRYSGFSGPDGIMDTSPPAVRLGNFWGGAVPASPQTFGQLKDRYRR